MIESRIYNDKNLNELEACLVRGEHLFKFSDICKYFRFDMSDLQGSTLKINGSKVSSIDSNNRESDCIFVPYHNLRDNMFAQYEDKKRNLIAWIESEILSDLDKENCEIEGAVVYNRKQVLTMYFE